MRNALALLTFLAFLLVTERANAEPTTPAEEAVTPRVALHHDWLVDGAVTGVLAGSLVTWSFLEKSAAGKACVLCDGSGTAVNAVDDFFRTALRRRDGTVASMTSHVVSYGLAPLMGIAFTIGAAAADDRIDEAPVNALIVTEASLVAVAVEEGLTAAIRRERPEVHALSGDPKLAALEKADATDSFPSGHTGSVMAITAATASVATLRGYRIAPLVWIVGTTLGITSTYLRIAADKHYFTDEVAGAAIGLGVGAGVPLLFHPRVAPQPTAATRLLRGAMITSSPVRGGRVVGLGWTF